jgi:hypothetical protein
MNVFHFFTLAIIALAIFIIVTDLKSTNDDSSAPFALCGIGAIYTVAHAMILYVDSV